MASNLIATRGLQPINMASTLVAMASNLIAMASTLIAMASNLIAMASTLVALASNLIAMASTLVAMASTLVAMASNPIAMASTLVAMASTLIAMASTLTAMASNLIAILPLRQAAVAVVSEVCGGGEAALRRHGRPVGRAAEDPGGGDHSDLQGGNKWERLDVLPVLYFG